LQGYSGCFLRRATAEQSESRQREMTSKWNSGVHGLVFSIPLFLLVASAGAQQAPTRSTDPVEVKALNAVFDKLGLKLWPAWYSGDPCVGAATNGTNIDIYQDWNPGIRCDCSDHDNTVCHIVQLKMFDLNVTGPIPEALRNLTRLTNLYEPSTFLPNWSEQKHCISSVE